MQCYWPMEGPSVGIAKVDKTKLNQWQRLSWRNMRSDWNDNQTAQFRFDFEGMASNTIAYIDDAMLIDLTAAFGAENEPTQEWCDTNIEYFSGNKTIQYEAPNKYDLTVTTPTKIQTGDILNCPYSGSAKSITLPKGQYKLECWGAQGGYRNSFIYGGNGGYSAGILNLVQKTIIYLYAGGAGNTGGTAGGFNGGGRRSSYNGGGGGTDIRIGSNSLYARVIVAGGGGSDGAGNKNGMYGGGTTGGSTTQSHGTGGYGGTQTGVSNSSWQTTSQSTSTTAEDNAYAGFGFGGNGISSGGGYAGAGGGGWYGGSGSYPDGSDDDDRGGGGGSGYMYTSSSASYYPSGCLLDSSHYLTNATILAGNATFVSPTGTSETGHTGNGYIRITVIEASSGSTLVKTTSDTWKEPVQMFVNTGVSTTISSGLVGLEYIESTGTQYIDTGIKASKNLKIEADIDISPASGWVMILGDYTNGSYFSWWRQNTTMRAYYGSNTKTLAELTGKRKYISNNTNNIWSIDTSKITVTPNSSDFSKNGNNLYLFSVNNGGNYNKASMKLYSCKIYDNGTLVRDFIPIKTTTNIYGLWDNVNKVLYENAGTGAFTGGSAISLTGWHKIKGVWAKTAAGTWSQTL